MSEWKWRAIIILSPFHISSLPSFLIGGLASCWAAVISTPTWDFLLLPAWWRSRCQDTARALRSRQAWQSVLSDGMRWELTSGRSDIAGKCHYSSRGFKLGRIWDQAKVSALWGDQYSSAGVHAKAKTFKSRSVPTSYHHEHNRASLFWWLYLIIGWLVVLKRSSFFGLSA